MAKKNTNTPKKKPSEKISELQKELPRKPKKDIRKLKKLYDDFTKPYVEGTGSKFQDWSNGTSRIGERVMMKNFQKGTYNPYDQDFALWQDDVDQFKDYGKTGLKDYSKGGTVEEMSLGGILAEAGAGAGTGALGASVGGPIGAGLGAIIGGGVGLIKGLASHFGEKKAEKAQAEQDKLSAMARASGQQNYQTMNNPFASTFPMGGQIPGGEPNVELEKEEVFQTPDGQVDQVDAPTHEQGGIKMNLPGGTRVWSDQLKSASGKTFAEEAGKLEKQIEKYKKILS